VPLAERSEKAAVENQQNVLLSLKIHKADFSSCEIRQREVRGGFVKFSAAHAGTTKITGPIPSAV